MIFFVSFAIFLTTEDKSLCPCSQRLYGHTIVANKEKMAESFSLGEKGVKKLVTLFLEDLT